LIISGHLCNITLASLLIPMMPEKKESVLTNTLPQIVLFPGFNEIAKKDWAQARSNVLDKITDGRIVELADVKKGAEGKPDTVSEKSLKDFEPRKAAEIVAETVSLDTLKKWEGEVVDSLVLKTVRDRLDTINKRPTNTIESPKKEYK